MLAGGATAAPRAPPDTGLGGRCAEQPRAAGAVPAASKVLARFPHRQRDLTGSARGDNDLALPEAGRPHTMV